MELEHAKVVCACVTEGCVVLRVCVCSEEIKLRVWLLVVLTALFSDLTETSLKA